MTAARGAGHRRPAATRYRLYVEATECAVTGLSAPPAADLLIAHFGASPADAEAVVGRVYRTHGPDTGTVRCDRAGRTAGRDGDRRPPGADL